MLKSTTVIPLSLAQFSNYSISFDSYMLNEGLTSDSTVVTYMLRGIGKICWWETAWESAVSDKIGSKRMANRVMMGILYTNYYSEIFVNTQCAE